MSEKTIYPPYDPNKQYKWEPEDKFEINGKDFGLLLNSVRSIVATEKAAHIRLMLQCNDVIEKMMAENVEKGIITEMPQPIPPSREGQQLPKNAQLDMKTIMKKT